MLCCPAHGYTLVPGWQTIPISNDAVDCGAFDRLRRPVTDRYLIPGNADACGHRSHNRGPANADASRTDAGPARGKPDHPYMVDA